jgi:hypothetical protein
MRGPCRRPSTARSLIHCISVFISFPRSSTSGDQTALSTLASLLDRYFCLLRRCTRSHCLDLLISTPVSAVKRDVHHIRDGASSCLERLGLPGAAAVFRLPAGDLAAQDAVDMKRVIHIPIAISQRSSSAGLAA